MAHQLPLPEPRYNMFIQQGATYRLPIRFEDADGVLVPLAGLSAWIHIRETADADDIVFSLTTANGRILLADTDPNITLYISDEDTEAITTWRKGEQDLLIEYANGDKDRLWKGIVTVSPAATREVA